MKKKRILLFIVKMELSSVMVNIKTELENIKQRAALIAEFSEDISNRPGSAFDTAEIEKVHISRLDAHYSEIMRTVEESEAALTAAAAVDDSESNVRLAASKCIESKRFTKFSLNLLREVSDSINK